MPLRLTSPHKFKERILLYGGGGVGKTQAVLSIARMLGEGRMHVVDNDYSFAYERALATDFTDAIDRVRVFECEPEWDGMIDALDKAVDTADPDVDWLVVDSISPTWEFVQNYMAEKMTGDDLPEYMAKLRKDSEDLKEFHRQMADAMPWNIIKKEYAKHIYIPLRQWKGHLVLTAEAKNVGHQDLKDDEIRDLYAGVGLKPTGEPRLHHVTSTTLLLVKKGHGRYTMSTIKDRNREEMERAGVEDFAMDYLREVAGWDAKVVKDV